MVHNVPGKTDRWIRERETLKARARRLFALFLSEEKTKGRIDSQKVGERALIVPGSYLLK